MFSSSEPIEVSGLPEKNSLSEVKGAFQKGRLAYGVLLNLQTHLTVSARRVARKSSSGVAWGSGVGLRQRM